MLSILSNEDKRQIEQYIKGYAYTDYTITERAVSIDSLLYPWSVAKKELFDLFGHQFILEKNILVEKDYMMLEDDLETAFYNSDDDRATKFIKEFKTKLTGRNGMFQLHYWLDDLLETRALVNNIYDGDSFTLETPKGPLQVNSGCKVSKILGKIAKYCDLKYYEDFRIIHSQVLNQKKLKGKLCLSIHPFDFITMSHNDSGWTSCMDWDDDGCYRRGTIEMMNSPIVVVAYLKSDTPMEIYGKKWSNKKWRELFIITPDIITGVKGYPYMSMPLEREVIAWLRELTSKSENQYGPYSKSIFEYNVYTNSYFEEYNKHYNLTFSTRTMYNDFGCGHRAIISENLPADASIFYSGDEECMCCGALDGSYRDEQHLVCQECNDVCYCEFCEEETHRSELTTVDNTLLCDYCYSNAVINCAICEDAHLRHNAYCIHLGRDGKVFPYVCIEVCDDCFDNKEKLKKYFKIDNFHVGVYHWDEYKYFNIEDCTPEGLKLFEIEKEEDLEDCTEYPLVTYNLN